MFPHQNNPFQIYARECMLFQFMTYVSQELIKLMNEWMKSSLFLIFKTKFSFSQQMDPVWNKIDAGVLGVGRVKNQALNISWVSAKAHT